MSAFLDRCRLFWIDVGCLVVGCWLTIVGAAVDWVVGISASPAP
jgi:hypothetical protein